MRFGWLQFVLFPGATLAVLLKTRSVSKTLLCLVAEVIARLYYFIVIWNPSVASLISGVQSGPSPAALTCAYDSLQAPPWNSVVQEGPVDAGDYYAEYHSHPIALLARVRAGLVAAGCKQFIFLAGDSSLDNKHWFFKSFASKASQLNNDEIAAPALNGYETILSPPRMVKDVSYWLNVEMAQRLGPRKVCCLMTSIEESTVEDRAKGLLLQDAFIRDNLTEEDYLILSVGGNDVALHPTLRTSFNMLLLTKAPTALIKSGLAPGFGYFVKLFHERIENLIKELVAKRKPRAVLVCMIYYPDERAGGSWADFTLGTLGYNEDPTKLQLIIKTIFEKIAEKGFHVPGLSRVVPFPLFSILNGKNHSDYVQRVEPSVQGGRKMAVAFADELLSQRAANSHL